MPNPNVNSVHVNRPLTNLSIHWLQSQDRFVADKVFPRVPVSNKSDTYNVFDIGDFLRDEMKERAPGTESEGGGYRVAQDPYNCKKWSLHKDIDDDTRANEDSPLNSDRNAMQWLMSKGMIRQEKVWAGKYFTTGIWGTDLVGVAGAPAGGQFRQWNEAASDPFVDIADAKAKIGLTGQDPNTLVLGNKTYLKLRQHPAVIDRVRSTIVVSAGNNMINVSQSDLAAAFEVDRILVMKASENTAAEGLTPVFSYIGGNHALLCHSASSPGIEVPSAGYTFTWRGLAGNDDGQYIKKFRMENIESDRVELTMAFDQKLTASSLGYFFSGAVA